MTRNYTISEAAQKSTGEIYTRIYHITTDFSLTFPTLAIWIEHPQGAGDYVYVYPQPVRARELSRDVLFFLFSTATRFGCLHQASLGMHWLTKRIRKGEVTPNKEWCKTVIK